MAINWPKIKFRVNLCCDILHENQITSIFYELCHFHFIVSSHISFAHHFRLLLFVLNDINEWLSIKMFCVCTIRVFKFSNTLCTKENQTLLFRLTNRSMPENHIQLRKSISRDFDKRMYRSSTCASIKLSLSTINWIDAFAGCFIFTSVPDFLFEQFQEEKRKEHVLRNC